MMSRCFWRKRVELDESGQVERKAGKKHNIAIIFRYAEWSDIWLMFFGTIGAIGDGMSTNCLLVYVSHLFNTLGYGKNPEKNANFMHEIEKVSFHFLS